MPAFTFNSPALVVVTTPTGKVPQVSVTDALPTKPVVPLYLSLVSTLPAEPPLAPLVTVKVSPTAVRVAWPTTIVAVATEQLLLPFKFSQSL